MWTPDPSIIVTADDRARASVPDCMTPLQARKALRASGLHAEVKSFISNLSDEEREAWEYATSIERDNAVIEKGRLALQMTHEQIDDLFRLGVTL
ncbi:hypothetical protein [Aurantimonas coralicida]|uniref:hypothetical protein n=1 Tax=Aurantimonas coralicida TaxID=182270 RepID=UPI00239EFE13|nr:hypothetical protein [Aurantimonas coralicida]MDE0922366.1 hypothetical protein [Aurantimonas coralicida]